MSINYKLPLPERIWHWFKILFWVSLVTITVLLFVYKIIVINVIVGKPSQISENTLILIEITLSNPASNVLFAILNGLILGVYLSIIGVNTGLKKKWQKILLLGFFAIYFILDIGTIGVDFTFNFWFLSHKTYSTNTVNGIYFFVIGFNLLLWLTIYLLSFLVEGETV